VPVGAKSRNVMDALEMAAFRRPHWMIGILAMLALFGLAAIPLIYGTDQTGVSGSAQRAQAEGSMPSPRLDGPPGDGKMSGDSD
jgi:hypothetical protein